jgi:hypothetical protein
MKPAIASRWAQTPPSQRRDPTGPEIAGGFPCGPWDRALFNELMYRLSDVCLEMDAFLAAAGQAPVDGAANQVLRASRGGKLNRVLPADVGGTPNAITLACSPAFSSPADVDDALIRFVVENVPTGPVTVQVDATAARPLVDATGAQLGAGSLRVGQYVQIIGVGASYLLFGGASPLLAVNEYVLLSDRKPAGTNGGDFPSGSWRRRDLNTVDADPNNLLTRGLVALAGNQITLGVGSWDVSGYAPACAVNSHRARFHNITDNVTPIWGTPGQTTQNTSTDQVTTFSHVDGQFAVTGTAKTFELQHRGEQNSSTHGPDVGFGLGSGFIPSGGLETYSVLRIRRLA